jgi:predicted small lipoprotein YifL
LILYSLRMRISALCPILLLASLAACQPPGRQTFAPAAVAPDTASVSATQAFSGRIALITILPGTTDFAGPVASGVRQALAIKPDAKFEVSAESPASATPDASAADLAALSATAASVAKAIVADGVAPANVTLTAKSSGLDANVLVYVK